ncbi:MAG TPA: hypothetical protein VF844_22360 [Ktedonobacteraceae bacterium]
MEEIENFDQVHAFLAEIGEALTIHDIQMLFKCLRKRINLTDHRITPHIFSLQEMLGQDDIPIVKNSMHLNDFNVQTQKH